MTRIVAAFLLGIAVALVGSAQAQHIKWVPRSHGGTHAIIIKCAKHHRKATAIPTRTSTPQPFPRPWQTAIPIDPCNIQPSGCDTPLPTLRPTAVPASCAGAADQCRSLELVNADRAAHGVGPLTLVLDATTDRHAADEASIGTIFHVDSHFPAESFPYDGFWAENTGAAGSVNTIEQLYMSEGTSTCGSGTISHACNIIDARWHYIAIGIAYGSPYGVYQVQDFR